jgi:hypothetical protein
MMALANYALCWICERKVIYIGDQDIDPEQDLAVHRSCFDDHVDAQAAAERDRLAADLRTCSLLAGTAGNSARAAAFETAAEIVESEPEPAGEQP